MGVSRVVVVRQAARDLHLLERQLEAAVADGNFALRAHEVVVVATLTRSNYIFGTTQDSIHASSTPHVPKPLEGIVIHTGVSCDRLSEMILEPLRRQIEPPSLFGSIVWIPSNDVQEGLLAVSSITDIPFLYLHAELVVPDMRYFFARTEKTHEHLHVIILQDLAHVLHDSSVCGVTKLRY